jgi:glutathione synthase/RimK-type ligase-like ATP-grasp enzyme
MMKVALITCRKLGGLTSDDVLVQAPLEKRHIEVKPEVWDDPDVDWNDFDGIVIRSTWDYHYRAGEFADWIRRCKAAKVPMWNPPDTVLWNMNKKYLLELEQKGFRIIPTQFVSQGDNADLAEILRKWGWKKAVVKPDISASSHKTWMVSSESVQDQHQIDFSSMLKESGVLIQEFRDEILSSGERSMIYFNHEFSHSVIKTPASGDFRSQEELGGIIRRQTPSTELVNKGLDLLESLQSSILYSRIDGVEIGNDFLLMEVELIEPNLYLKYSESAAEKFAECIYRQIINKN